MLFSVEQVFVGKDERRAPLKMPLCEARGSDGRYWINAIQLLSHK